MQCVALDFIHNPLLSPMHCNHVYTHKVVTIDCRISQGCYMLKLKCIYTIKLINLQNLVI